MQYWFVPLNTAIATLDRLRSLHVEVSPSDWRLLSTTDAGNAFYPVIEHSATRRPGFFVNLDNLHYHRLYEYILTDPKLRFPNIEALLDCRNCLRESYSVVNHAGNWLNGRLPRQHPGNRFKAPLRLALVPALRPRYGNNADARSVDLQHLLVTYVRQNVEAFQAPEVKKFLESPRKRASIGLRFRSQPWLDVLNIVRDYVGPFFQHKSLQHLNHPEPSSSVSTLAQELSQQLPNITATQLRPYLHSPAAIAALKMAIEPAIQHWARTQCTQALQQSSAAECSQLQSDLAISEAECHNEASLMASQVPPEGLLDESFSTELSEYDLVDTTTLEDWIGLFSRPFEPLDPVPQILDPELPLECHHAVEIEDSEQLNRPFSAVHGDSKRHRPSSDMKHPWRSDSPSAFKDGSQKPTSAFTAESKMKPVNVLDDPRKAKRASSAVTDDNGKRHKCPASEHKRPKTEPPAAPPIALAETRFKWSAKPKEPRVPHEVRVEVSEIGQQRSLEA